MSHHRTHSPSQTLTTAIKMSVAVFFLEALGGFFTGSLALLSDASHVFSDLLALLITLFTLWLASRPADSRRTFGWHRAEVLGALANGLLLLIMATSIGAEAWGRLLDPPKISGAPVLIIGLIGILPNIWTVARLKGTGNINIKSAFLHALGDMLASVAVVIGGTLILITGQTIFDPVASLIVVVILLVGAVRLLRQVFMILLEGTPASIDLARVSKIVCTVPGVRSTHDVHLWTLCSDLVYFTGHLVIDDHPDINAAQAVANSATRALDAEVIHHATLQIETPEHACTKKESCEILH